MPLTRLEIYRFSVAPVRRGVNTWVQAAWYKQHVDNRRLWLYDCATLITEGIVLMSKFHCFIATFASLLNTILN